MIGYILMALGGYLIYDDIVNAKRNKIAKILANAENFPKGGAHENVLENGTGSGNRDSGRKPGSASEKTNRKRGVTPTNSGNVSPTNSGNVIGVPVTEKGEIDNELHEKPIQQVKLDTPGSSVRDNSNSESDAAPLDHKTKGVTDTGDKENAGNENNLENGTGNDGDNVDG